MGKLQKKHKSYFCNAKCRSVFFLQNAKGARHTASNLFDSMQVFNPLLCLYQGANYLLYPECPTTQQSSKYNSLPPLSGIVVIGCRETVSKISSYSRHLSPLCNNMACMPHIQSNIPSAAISFWQSSLSNRVSAGVTALVKS